MNPTIVGLDPGTQGALAVVDGETVILEPMPLGPDKKVDLRELVRLLSHYSPTATRVYMELAGIRPRQAAQATAAQWRGFGRLEGVLAALAAPLIIVRPEVWSAAYDHGVTDRDPDVRKRKIKKARAEIAARLYPGISLKRTERCTTADAGMVDALLVADYGYKLHRQQQPVGI